MTTRAAWTWPTLHAGQRTVLLDMLIHGDMSRAELARRTGMSRGSLTRLSREVTNAKNVVSPLDGRALRVHLHGLSLTRPARRNLA